MKFFNIIFDNLNETIECRNNIYNINFKTDNIDLKILEKLLSTNEINYININKKYNDLKLLEIKYPIKYVNRFIQLSNLSKL